MDALIAAGVDYLFTGHWHSNRVQAQGPILEFNTQPLVMGGLDLSPAGYRVVTLDGDALSVTHHTVVEAPVFEVVSPLSDGCVRQPSFDVVAAVELGTDAVTVSASLDNAAPMELVYQGGWAWAASVGGISVGNHTLEVTVWICSAPTFAGANSSSQTDTTGATGSWARPPWRSPA